MTVIDQMLLAIQQVGTPAALTGAVIGAFLEGYFILGALATNPRYSAVLISAREAGQTAALYLLSAVGVFWVTQFVASYFDGDFGWARVLSRFGLNTLFVLVAGAGVWRRVLDDQRARKRVATDQARHDIEEHKNGV